VRETERERETECERYPEALNMLCTVEALTCCVQWADPPKPKVATGGVMGMLGNLSPYIHFCFASYMLFGVHVPIFCEDKF
jgi:hypothetical protein